MDRAERLRAHAVGVPDNYMPNPVSHLANPRDFRHYMYTHNMMDMHGCKSLLDCGSWDCWLPMLLLDNGFEVDAVELIPSLAAAGRRYAAYKGFKFTCYEGFLDEVEIPRTYDCVSAYEVLEHIPLEEVSKLILKFEMLSTKIVLISLPNQKCEDNPQHKWTPDPDVIKTLMGTREYEITYQDYHGIPGNWFVKFNVRG